VELSRRRAEAVKTFMMERGVDAERVLTRGEGPDMPIADNKTRAGRQQNRRIEFQIVQ
jgi:OmpA-OmpF porin, OOP family